MLSLIVKKVDVFKFDGVAESDNTGSDAIWKQEKIVLEVLFSSVLLQFKKYPPF